MTDLNFHHLAIFYTVARLGSFSKASEEMYISQPSVSLQIRELERYYGAPLFHRQSRKIRLTDVGEVVFGYAQRIFNAAQEMGRSVESLKELMMGRLALGASSTPGEYLLPVLLGRYKQRYPEVEVDLRISNTASVAKEVLAYEIDLGLVGDRVEENSLVCQSFYTDQLVVFVWPQHPFAPLGKVGVEALADQAFIMREPGSATRRIAEARLAELGVHVRVAMQLGSNEAVKRAVAAGLGIGILSRLALEVEASAGYLTPVEVEGLECHRDFYLLYHPNRYLSRTQRAFMELAEGLA